VAPRLTIAEDDMRLSAHHGVIRGVLLALLVLLAVAPIALAQGDEPAVEDCAASGPSLATEEIPEGMTREMLFVTPVASSGFADTDTATGEPVPDLLGASSVVCLDANTEIEIGVQGGQDTTTISQYFMVLLVVLEGTPEFMLVEACALPLDGNPCTETEGMAFYRLADDRTDAVDLPSVYTPLPPGSILILADVTFSVRTGDTPVRLLTAGVTDDPANPIAGGACPTSCGRTKPP
jgi:hypothetical protein